MKESIGFVVVTYGNGAEVYGEATEILRRS